MNLPRWSRIDTLLVAVVMAMGAGVFLIGITWGLPSRDADAYLFGGRPAWSGADIVRLAPEAPADADRGADVDANPILDRSRPVLLNGTDAQRAEIVRRYRLFSYQPDEMITFKSLSGMSPGRLDLDPRLYQYGGLWIYPVGALLKVTSLIGLTDVRADEAFYLDRPEEFGKFYVVARAYSAAWGLAGLAVVYWLARRMSGSRAGAVAAAACYCWMPAVVSASHEAKPHLAGAVLMLLTVAAGTVYVDTGRRRWAWVAGGMAGASVGLVLSGLWAFAVLPAMVQLRRATCRERIVDLAWATVVGVVVYVVTNPYVAINAVVRPSRLASNLQNSTAMYAVGGSSNAVVNAVRLVAEGATIVVAVAGVLVLVVGIARVVRRDSHRRDGEGGKGFGWTPLALLGTVAGIVLVQFVLLAGGKPGEYGRFALVPDVALAVFAVSVVAGARAALGPILRGILLTVVAGATVPFGAEYVYAFLRDARSVTSRVRAAQELASMPGSIGLRDEPAPYLMPPVNLFERELVLLPAGGGAAPVNYVLSAVDGAGVGGAGEVLLPSRWRRGTLWRAATPISWANKRFVLTPVGGMAGAAATQTGPAGSDQP